MLVYALDLKVNSVFSLKGGKQRVTLVVLFTVFGSKDISFGKTVNPLKTIEIFQSFAMLRITEDFTVTANKLTCDIIKNGLSATLKRQTSERKTMGKLSLKTRFLHLLKLFCNRDYFLSCFCAKAVVIILIQQETLCNVVEVLITDVNKILSCFRTELVKEYAVILVILEGKYLLNRDYVLNELSSRCAIGIEIEPSDLALFFIHIETVIGEAVLIQAQYFFSVCG